MSSKSFDPHEVAREVAWLKAHPEFEERPASITEFLGEGYLNIESLVRPGIRQELIKYFGTEVNPYKLAQVQRAMLTGGIGIGKTTIASICLPYMAHWTLCIKDPQKFFDFLPGSRIAFMQMSTSENQAVEVIFGDIKARIQHSEWFVENYPFDDKYTKQIRFPQKDIWILPGDSAETSFEGYNILGGILDEADSHKVTKDKDYADSGYNTIHARITSRFQDRGLLIVIGQMKKANGFAAKKFQELSKDPFARASRMTIWESLGWDKFSLPDGTHDSFWYDIRRKQIIPSGVGSSLTSENIIEVPNVYKQDFINKPEMAARDLGGFPPKVEDPFISLEHKVDDARARWIDKHGDEPPVDDNPTQPRFAKWFRANGDPKKRTVHIDLAVSSEGDALGFAMGHVSHLVEVDDELKPYISIDCLLRMKAMPGTEIMIGDIRRIIYHLKDDLRFKIKKITMDGFQSTDTRQQLQKRRFEFEYVSMDKATTPYEDLREAIYEDRIDFPPYITYLHKGALERVEIAVQELLDLTHDGKKVDHPPEGSKDVADAMAGVTYTLIGERTYRRGISSLDKKREEKRQEAEQATGTDNFSPFNEMQAPLPPTAGGLGLVLPDKLKPPGFY